MAPASKREVKASLDRLAIALLCLLAGAGALIAVLMVSIADRSEKSVQEIKQTKIKVDVDDMQSVPTNDETMASFASFIKQHENDTTIALTDTQFDEQNFARLAQLKNLKTLKLHNCTFNTEWLRYVAELKGLNRIELDGCDIDKKAMFWLNKLPKLKMLRLFDAGVDDETLADLPPQLVTLSLPRNKITNAGVTHLLKLKSMENLDLSRTLISDRGLKELAKMTSLSTLKLCRCTISDAGLLTLAPMKTLHKLVVFECPGISGDGVQALHKVLPRLNIVTVDTSKKREF